MKVKYTGTKALVVDVIVAPSKKKQVIVLPGSVGETVDDNYASPDKVNVMCEFLGLLAPRGGMFAVRIAVDAHDLTPA